MFIGSFVVLNIFLTHTQYTTQMPIGFLICLACDRECQWRSHTTIAFNDIAVVPQCTGARFCFSIHGRNVATLQQKQFTFSNGPFDILWPPAVRADRSAQLGNSRDITVAEDRVRVFQFTSDNDTLNVDSPGIALRFARDKCIAGSGSCGDHSN